MKNRRPFGRVYLELTNACDCACAFCPHEDLTRPLSTMNVGMAKRLISEIDALNLARELTFHVLGEPSLHPDFFAILSFASRLSLNTLLTTNGMSLGKVFGHMLRAHQLDHLCISVQTPDEQTYAHRHAPLSFTQYKQGILRFLGNTYATENPSHYTLRFLNTYLLEQENKSGELYGRACSDFIGQNHAMQTWLQDIYAALGVDTHNASEAVHKLAYTQTALSNRIDIYDRIQFEVQHMLDWRDLSRYADDPQGVQGNCAHRQDEIAILANGDVVLCCLDFNGHTKLGNVRDGLLSDVLESDRACQVFDAFDRGRVALPYCRRCLRHWQSTLKHLTPRTPIVAAQKTLRETHERVSRVW